MLPSSDPPRCSARMSKLKKVRAAGKCWQGRGELRDGPWSCESQSMPCSVPGVMQLHVIPFGSNSKVQLISKTVHVSRLYPAHCLPLKCCISPAATRVWMLMTKKSKVTELLDPTVLSTWMYPSCLHTVRCPPCQLAELHPPGMALQLCNRYICLLAQLKAPKTVVDQDRNSKTVSLR